MTDEREDYRDEIADLKARVEHLEKLNARLMGDDERLPRYTTQRLRHEVGERTKLLLAEADAAWLTISILDARLDALCREIGPDAGSIYQALLDMKTIIRVTGERST